MLPDKAELKIISDALADANADPLAVPRAVEAFGNGEFTTETVESWVALQKIKQPDMWTKANDPLADHSELVEKAFSGKGDAVARSTFVRTVGESAANEAAKRFGLRDIGDFTNKGEAPPEFTRQDKGANNPYSDSFVKKHGQDKAHAEIARLTRVIGTKALASLARAQNKDISGRALRTA